MVIPRCCSRCRLDALDAIEALLTEDAVAEIDSMIASGWDVGTAREVVIDGYRRWLLGRFDDAILFAVELHELLGAVA